MCYKFRKIPGYKKTGKINPPGFKYFINLKMPGN